MTTIPQVTPLPLNRLYYGDNLRVLRDEIGPESVDLIYLDPPFNSNRSHNVFLKTPLGEESDAQIEAFRDTWTWNTATSKQYDVLTEGRESQDMARVLRAMYELLGPSDVMAYLVMMAPRLHEMERVLKPTGSIYLHCDPTSSHYLKLLMDAIFGAKRFGSEIVWKRSSAHSDTKQGRRQYGHIHDTLLFYTKGPTWTWNAQYTPYDARYVREFYSHTEAGTNRRYRLGDLTAAKPGGDVSYEWHGRRPYKGRYWAYSRENMDQMLADDRIYLPAKPDGVPSYIRFLDEMPGVPLQDIWTDLGPAPPSERLSGYPTKKPKALLDRIIATSSNPNDVVLDPFCGCGTTIESAQRLGRLWIGIDIAYIAVDVIVKSLGDSIADTYQCRGIPTDLHAAAALWNSNPLDYERWAVSLVNGWPNKKQVGDKGVDGRIRFHTDVGHQGTCIVSVKGGRQIFPSMVHQLMGAVTHHRAEMGLLIVHDHVTKGMTEIANHSDSYTLPFTGAVYPRIQIVTVADLLSHRLPSLPTAIPPYTRTTRQGDQLTLGAA